LFSKIVYLLSQGIYIFVAIRLEDPYSFSLLLFAFQKLNLLLLPNYQPFVTAYQNLLFLHNLPQLFEPHIQLVYFGLEVVHMFIDTHFPFVEVDFVEHGVLEVSPEHGCPFELLKVCPFYFDKIFRFLFLSDFGNVDEFF
jgi:hypothetical protein